MSVDGQCLDVGDKADRLRAGFVRMRGEQRIHVAEQQQCVGTHHLRDKRGQPIIVTEMNLVGGDRVVLVDDRHHAHAQQRTQGA